MNEIDNNEIKSILFNISNKFILPMYNNLKDENIMRKDNNDLVTSVDLQVEEELNNILRKLLPNSLFVGEEEFSKTPNILNSYLEKFQIISNNQEITREELLKKFTEYEKKAREELIEKT